MNKHGIGGNSMSYDVKCYELAKEFLQDSELNVDFYVSELAQNIQNCIEDSMAFWEEQKEKNA